ncbi:hypothetical protein SMD11_1726 [Streptomyces albireticuli]|uniref:Transaldolase n=1 Tax=Streptomyces albireticuli TaxID=1940 RepID=A0A1Z2KZA8_9ACTN|nr:transaldolase [Streptomyces albireticuli]ARZ67387.1 hypothetical protein SMD11_1726 [Streptomyces albireticuli]
MSGDGLGRLAAAGVSVWVTGLSRDRLADGSLAALIRHRRVAGLVSDPAFLARSVAAGRAYAQPLRDLARRGAGAGRALWELTVPDARRACDVLRPVHERTAGVDGLVSLGLDPRLAHDSAATLAEARALWRAVARPNAMVGIPATDAGLTALAGCLAEGINVQATLVFSAERYGQVADAYLDGLERARAAGRALASLSSVASFHAEPVDTAVDALLTRDGTLEARALLGTAAGARARLVHARHATAFDGPGWHRLTARGARPQRLLWAGTTVRNPAYRDTRYADRLLARSTVTALDEETLEAVAGHGAAGRPWTGAGHAEARRLLGHLRWCGIDHHELTARLEAEALKERSGSWHRLLDTLTLALDAAAGPRPDARPPAFPHQETP